MFSVVMLSYATLMFGSVLCMAVLALSQPKDSPITALREAVVPALRGIANGLAPPPPQVATSPPLPVNMASTDAKAESLSSSQKGPEMMQVAMASGGGSVTVEFSSATTRSRAPLTEDDNLSLTLDDLAYRSCLLGFGFLTVGIISGAVWANEAWGNYWSWDPKETWALICWFVYAFYLHTRQRKSGCFWIPGGVAVLHWGEPHGNRPALVRLLPQVRWRSSSAQHECAHVCAVQPQYKAVPCGGAQGF